MLSLPLLVSMDTPKKYGNTKRTGVGKGRRILNLVLCVYVLSVGSNFMNFKNLSLLGTHLLFRGKGEQGVIKPLKTVFTHMEFPQSSQHQLALCPLLLRSSTSSHWQSKNQREPTGPLGP